MRRTTVLCVVGATALAACVGPTPGSGPAPGSSPASSATATTHGPPAPTTSAAPTTPQPTGGPGAPVPEPGAAARLGTVRRDLAYGPAVEQRLDLHVPRGAQRPPLVVFLHGGAWATGDKNTLDGVGYLPRATVTRDRLLAGGYAIASVNYRLSGTARYPAQLRDLESAVAYLRREGDRLGVDASRIALFGESAGGHLVLLGARTIPGVRVVVSYYGVSDLRTLDADRAAQRCGFRPGTQAEQALLGVDPTRPEGAAVGAAASPIAQVRPGLPPALLVHGSRDCTVPPVQSHRMAQTLRRAGVEARYREIDADHAAAPFWSSPEIVQALLDVLGDHLR